MNDVAILPGSPRPNVYGPVTPSQMFERTFVLLRENPGLFFGIVLVVIGVEIVVGAVLGGGGLWVGRSTAESAPAMKLLFIIPLSLIGGAFIYIFTQIVQGAIFFATQAKLANAPMSVGEACKLAAEKVWRMIGVSILVALRMLGYGLLLYLALGVVIVIVVVVVGAFAHGVGHTPFNFRYGQHIGLALFMGLLFLALFAGYLVIMVWLMMRYAVAIPACLAENVSITEAIRRSIYLTRDSKGRLIALFLVMFGIYIAIFCAVGIPAQLMMMHWTQAHMDSVPIWFEVGSTMFGIVWNIVSAVLVALMGIALTVCYFDLRVRKDGFGAVPAVAIPAIPTAGSSIPPEWPIEDLPVT